MRGRDDAFHLVTVSFAWIIVARVVMVHHYHFDLLAVLGYPFIGYPLPNFWKDLGTCWPRSQPHPSSRKQKDLDSYSSQQSWRSTPVPHPAAAQHSAWPIGHGLFSAG